MAARSVTAQRQEGALNRIREILEKHHPETEERLNVYTPALGSVPNSIKMPDQFDLYVAECLQMFAELLDPILEDRKPKKRGRPPRKQEAS